MPGLFHEATSTIRRVNHNFHLKARSVWSVEFVVLKYAAEEKITSWKQNIRRVIVKTKYVIYQISFVNEKENILQTLQTFVPFSCP